MMMFIAIKSEMDEDGGWWRKRIKNEEEEEVVSDRSAREAGHN